MTNNTHTTAEGLRRAHDAFSGDWDSHGVTMVFLPTAVVEALLAARGWTYPQSRGGTGAWIAPTGERVWETGDAVALALAAEAVPETPSTPSGDQPRTPDQQAHDRKATA